MARKHISKSVQAEVAIKCRRRCALCFGLNNDLSERPGQIAHLNQNNEDSELENLVWLCLEHHDRYDSRTSQSKNYMQQEVETYRNELHRRFRPSSYSEEDIKITRRYLQEFRSLFQVMENEYDGLADTIDTVTLQKIADVRDYWETSNLRSFNIKIRQLQDGIARNICDIRAIYETEMYDGISNFIRYDSRNFGRSKLYEKRTLMRTYIDKIITYRAELERIAIN